MSDIEVEKVEPANEDILEEWSRVTDEPELHGVGAARSSDGDWPYG